MGTIYNIFSHFREENLISGIVSSGNKELSKSAAFLLSNKKQLHPLNGLCTLLITIYLET